MASCLRLETNELCNLSKFNIAIYFSKTLLLLPLLPNNLIKLTLFNMQLSPSFSIQMDNMYCIYKSVKQANNFD